MARRLGFQSSDDASLAALYSDDTPDPHDEMMLAKRQTSVLTNGGATQLLDTAPTFYGDQSQEQELFNSIGPDGGASRRRAQDSQYDDLAADTGTAPPGTAAGAAQAAAAKPKGHWPLILGLGAGAAGLIGLAYLFLHKPHRR